MNENFTVIDGFGPNRQWAANCARTLRKQGVHAEALERPCKPNDEQTTDDDDETKEWVVVARGNVTFTGEQEKD